jgi:hypothetical protein
MALALRTAKKFEFMYSPEEELRSLSPNFRIHVSVHGLYIPTLGPPVFSCSRIGRLIRGIYKSLIDT